MKFIKPIMDYIEERMLVITILATFIISVIVFSKFWIKLINIIWVHPIMSKLYGYELLIAIVYGAIIALYYYHKFKFTQYYNWNRVYYFGLLFFIYIKCFHSKEWSYSLITDKTNFFAWTNLIFLVIILEFLLYLTCRKREGIKYTQQLEIEKTTGGGDAYQRNGCCESVYKIINTCFFDDQSFAVGITGSWGSGKTTYIKSLKDRFKDSKEDITIIDFEPWKNDNPSLIIKSFFSLLKSKLKPYISNISIPIDKYVSSLLDCDVPIMWKLFLNTIHFLSTTNKNSPYDQIYNCLSTTRHRVVVFVDDIDRLDKNEIKEVLRLIRNTANFPYIQFIVAYDKDYIISTLKDSGIESPTNYLEKFFNLEITLPMYENRIICSQLERRLSEDMNELGFKGVDKTIHDMIYYSTKSDNLIHIFLVPCILTNIRDVIRFRNSFYISMHMIKNLHIENEIEIDDLFYIELLRYRYNNIYMILRNRPTTIIKSNGGAVFDYNFEYLENIIKISYNVYNQNLIIEILDYLFRSSIKRYSLCKRRYFTNYFMFRIDNKIFTEMDFLSLSGLSDVELSTRLDNLYKEKNQNEFKFQIYEMLENIYAKKNFDGESRCLISDYENIYDILISILKCKENKNEALIEEIRSSIIEYLEGLTFYDDKHFKLILELYNHLDLSSMSYNSFIDNFLLTILSKSNLHSKCYLKNIDNLTIIVVNFFKNIKDVVTMSNAITRFTESVSKEKITANDLVIDVPNLSRIKLEYFISYNNKLSDKGFILLGNYIDYENTDTDKVRLVKEALEVMKNEIETNPELYFSNFIHKGDSADDANTLHPEPFYLDIFGSNENFEKFLESHKLIPSYVRVNRYWALYKYFNYNNLKFDNNINLDNMLANNFENEWNSFLELKKLAQKCKNKQISNNEFNNAYALFQSMMQ